MFTTTAPYILWYKFEEHPVERGFYLLKKYIFIYSYNSRGMPLSTFLISRHDWGGKNNRELVKILFKIYIKVKQTQ